MFYKSIYTSDKPSVKDINCFLEKTGTGKSLIEAHRNFLDSPITASELSLDISSMKNNKSTG